MSFWTNPGQSLEHVGREIKNGVTAVVAPGLKAQEEAAKEARRLTEAGINAYNDQKMQAEQESARVDAEKNAERDRIQTKQMRAMRRAYRAPGFMSPESENGLRNTLG